MNKLIPILLCLVVSLPLAASSRGPGSTPEATLDAYFKILTERDVENISALMTSGSMSRLKKLMTDSLESEKARGDIALQQRFFGKPVTRETIRNTPASFFLDQLARDILNAAEMQHFFVDDRDIIGSVRESDDMVHFVVRLYLHQEERRNSDILVYTLIDENGTWKLEFPPTIRQTLAVFEAGLARPPQAPDNQ